MFARKSIIRLTAIGVSYVGINPLNANLLFKCDENNIEDLKNKFNDHISNVKMLSYENSLKYISDNKLKMNEIKEIKDIVEYKKTQEIEQMINQDVDLSQIFSHIFKIASDAHEIDIFLEKAYRKKFDELLMKQNFYDIENFVNVNVGNKYTFFGYHKNIYINNLYPISTQYVCEKFSKYINDNFQYQSDIDMINHIMYYYINCIDIDNFFSNPNINKYHVLTYITNISHSDKKYYQIQKYLGCY